MSTSVTMRWLGLVALSGSLGCTSLREWTRDGASLFVPTPPESRIVGRVSAGGRGVSLGRAAVYLEPVDGESAEQPVAAAVVHQHDGGFEPEFIVVAVGQPVLFTNQDKIFHGVFSYSEPNAFTQRPFGPGETRSVRFNRPGLVRAYCPLHATRGAVMLVVPDTHYAVPDTRGNFQISGVPAGRYRLSLWTEQHGVADREVSLAAGEEKRADLTPAPRR